MKRATCTGPPSGEPVQVVFISRRRPAGVGLVGEDLAGGDLVHEFPQTLAFPFPLHQVSGPFWRVGGGDLVHETPQALDPPFPLHQVSGPFRRGAGGELVHEFPQAFEPPFPLHQVSGHFRRGTGGDLVHEFPQALVPPFPLHQVSGPFRPVAGGDLVHETPQAIVLPFPLHQVSDSFRPAAGHVGAWLLAKPYSTVRPRQHRRRFPGAWPVMLAPGSSRSHIPPSGHANTGAVFPARGRPSWRLAPREAIFHRQVTPTPAPFSRRGADQVGAWLPAKPYSTVRPRQHRRRLPGTWPAKLASGSSQSLCLPSGHANTGGVFPARRWRLGPGRRGAWQRKNNGLRGVAHHVRSAVGALAPEDVVLGDEGIRDCGSGRTTSGPPPAPWPRKTWCPATKE